MSTLKFYNSILQELNENHLKSDKSNRQQPNRQDREKTSLKKKNHGEFQARSKFKQSTRK